MCETPRIPDLPEKQSKRGPRSDTRRNRAAIIDVARALLADQPQVSMATISTAAGLGRNTIYRHFATRQALIEAIRAETSVAGARGEDDDRDHLRPAGELANVSPTPMSVWDVLNKVAPFQLGIQVVAEAQRLPGVTSAALYLVDLDGLALRRLAGPENFPMVLEIAQAIGPDVDRQALPLLRAAVRGVMPDVAVAPLDLRGRAGGVLVAVGAEPHGLRELAQEAAAALMIADRYTGLSDRIRRPVPMSAAAELQQGMLPPRIVRIGGAMLAANVLPSNHIGGDWFDYTDNPEHAWLGILDMQGHGTRAAAAAAVALAAFRAGRHDPQASPARIIHLMHEVILELADSPPTASATIATWNSATAMLHWVTCGDPPPYLASGGDVELLGEHDQPRLGDSDFPARLRVQSRRLRPGEQILFLSDGILGRTDTGGQPFGVDGVRAALRALGHSTATTTLRAIQDAAFRHSDQPLSDDATLMVLTPAANGQSPLTGPPPT